MTEKELTRSQKVVLKKIRELEKASAKDLYNIEVLEESYASYRSLSNALNTIAEQRQLLATDKDGKTKIYSLNEKGKRKLRKIVERENKNIEESEIELYDKENAKSVFIDFFEQKAEEEWLKASSGRSSVTLDFEKLVKFDPELADDLLENPEEVLDACREAIREFPHTKDDLEIRVSNISDIEVKEISEISPNNDKGNLITVEGVLEATTEPKAELVSGTFECESCGALYEKEQDGNKPKSPYKCECGSKKFSIVDLEHETVVLGRVKDKPGKTSRKTIPVKISGSLAEDRAKTLNATGQGIRVTGYIELFSPKKTADFLDVRLIANNLEIEEDKWEDIEVSEKEREKLEEFKEDREFSELRKNLVNSLASERIAGLERMKEAVLVWFLGRSNDSNLHVLVVGEPGLGKSDLMSYVSEEFPRTLKSVGTGSTGVGITATVRKDELTGDFVAEAGAVPQAHQGFHILDESDKAKEEDLSKLNEALSDKSITLSKANVHAEIPADVSEFAMGNPKKSLFDRHDPVYQQIPISREDLLERFDIKLAIKREDIKDDREAQEEILDKMLERSEASPNLTDEGLDKRELINYIAIAQSIDPEFSDEVVEKMKNVYFELTDVDRNNEKKSFFGPRRFSSLQKLCIAYARMDLSDTVEIKHLNRASRFLRDCYETMDFEIGKDSFDDITTERNRVLNNVKDLLKEKADRKPVEEKEFIEKASNKFDLEDSKVEEILSQIKRNGGAYEPKDGKIQRM
jgi:replicative DNA helicase Mcm